MIDTTANARDAVSSRIDKDDANRPARGRCRPDAADGSSQDDEAPKTSHAKRHVGGWPAARIPSKSDKSGNARRRTAGASKLDKVGSKKAEDIS